MELFTNKFVKRWNKGRLDDMFYTGLSEQVLDQTKRTRHQWGFVKKLNDSEQMQLASTKDSVSVATRKTDLLQQPSARSAPRPAESTSSHKRERDAPSSRDDDDDFEQRRNRHKMERKSHRSRHDEVLDELVPRETGREAMLEKRRQVGQKMHGAARDRDANRDGLDLSEDFLMGSSGSSDLKQRIARREQTRDRRANERQEKLATYAVRDSGAKASSLDSDGNMALAAAVGE